MIASVDVASTVTGATAVPTTAVISSSMPLPVIVAVISPVNEGAIENWNWNLTFAVSVPFVSQPSNVISLPSLLIVNEPFFEICPLASLMSTPEL